MKKIFISLLTLFGFIYADINDTIQSQCQNIVDKKEEYKLPVDSYINGVVTGVLTAVDKKYHRKQIVTKRDKIIMFACKEAFKREDSAFESAFVKGVQVTIDRRWSRFRKVR